MNSFRVLVVEDHEASAHALCRFICEKLPFAACAIAHCLNDGLVKAVEFSAHLTLLDLGIPRLPGAVTAAVDDVIRSIEFFPPPVVVMTDADDPDDHLRLKCRAFGAKGFFSKKILRDNIGRLEREVEAARIIECITGAHLEAIAPILRAEFEHNGRRDGCPTLT